MPNTTSTYEPLVLVDTADLPEEEWLEYRRRGIGGSDAAAILGVSPFATARDLYYDKLKVVSYEDGESNWVQKKVGHLLEDLVAEIFHVKTGFEIYQVKKMFYHPVYFRVGDKVMQTKNNAKASNGDIGYIRKMGRNAKNEMVVTIEFSGDRIAEYGMEEMGYMELAYATTVHKAMGSEFDIVIMPILRSHYIMLNRNIVYTAITRAKEQVIPVGQKKALIMAILKKATGKRNTQLGERIGKYLKAFTRQNELKKVS